MRVVIRKPLQPFVTQLAQDLGVEDYGEAINYLILQVMDKGMRCISITAPNAPQAQLNTEPKADDLSDLAGLLGD
ncbi:hypothetical protein [Calothrix sp. NIES-2098]|uniref:hypothetical protein n=1 Tax=Calothrix sp. NIES-2098 TaxID=1954171 RepID=UPI000B60A98F|nr:hypothetical protein NIES2098_42110 [Calothrix sp. NIES-2098]